MTVMERPTVMNQSAAVITTRDGFVDVSPVPSGSRYIPEAYVPHATAKRALDIFLSIVILTFTAPLLLLAAIAIKLTSRGPVLFRQTRVGLGGRNFTCLKLRSMCVDAEDRRHRLLHLNEVSGPVFKIKNDPRITSVGRLLRKTSLDEIPQLINVLRGEMSIVGPRPPLPAEVAEYSERVSRRLSVKPGLTCLWQVSGRSNVSFDHWMELDLMYIETMSLRQDVSIILRTVPAVLTCRGAH